MMIMIFLFLFQLVFELCLNGSLILVAPVVFFNLMYKINIFAHVYYNSIDSLKHNIKNAPYVVRWGLRG